MAPGEGFGVDRGVDRRRGNSQRHVCSHTEELVASLQFKRVWRTSVLLIICRSRVRAPPAPPAVLCFHRSIRDWSVDRRNLQLCSLPRRSFGHIEQLPSGSWRARVYAGKDLLSGRELRFRKTSRTEVEAQIELGKLLELAETWYSSAPAERERSFCAVERAG